MIHLEPTPIDERVVRCRENAAAAIEDAEKHPASRDAFYAIANQWVRLSIESQAALKRGEEPPEIPSIVGQ